MATKLENQEARLFTDIYICNGDVEAVYDKYRAEIQLEADKGYRTQEQAEMAFKSLDERLSEVIGIYGKVHFFDEPELYAVEGWGYDQTNLEDIMVIGKLRGCYIAMLDSGYHVYSIAARKYDNKDKWTSLDGDGVRCTSWDQPYTSRDLKDNASYNAYYGR